MRRCSIIEFEENHVSVEFYNQETQKKYEYIFDSWDEAFEALPELPEP